MGEQSVADQRMNVAERAVKALVASGTIGVGVETQVHNALYYARHCRADPGRIERLEAVSKELATLFDCQRSNRPNLYASKLLRLKRLLAD